MREQEWVLFVGRLFRREPLHGFGAGAAGIMDRHFIAGLGQRNNQRLPQRRLVFTKLEFKFTITSHDLFDRQTVGIQSQFFGFFLAVECQLCRTDQLLRFKINFQVQMQMLHRYLIRTGTGVRQFLCVSTWGKSLKENGDCQQGEFCFEHHGITA